MELVNRIALVVTPKRRYAEWTRSVAPDTPRLEPEQLKGLATVFLVEALDEEPEMQAVIDEHYDEVFEYMLEAWTSDESLWPPNRTPHVFRDWFDITLQDLLFDLSPDAPWLEADGDEDLRTWCGWCGEPIGEDAEIVMLGASVAEKERFRGLEGEIIPLPVGDRTVDAVVVTADSPAKKAGRDLMFIVCSEECASQLREALNRSRAAILS